MRIIITLAILLGTFSCSLKQPNEHGVRIVVQEEKVRSDLFEGAFPRLFALPSAMTDFNCFSVNVTGPGLPSKMDLPGVCNSSNNMSGKGIGIFVPPVGRGLPIEITLPSGPTRNIDVYGVYPSPAQCGGANSSFSGYLLGSVVADIFTNSTISVPVSFSSVSSVSCSDPSTNYNYYLYVVNNGPTTISQYVIDSSTGALTAIGGTPATGTNPRGSATTPSGKYLYVLNRSVNTISGYSIAQATGALTALPGSPFGLAGLVGPEALSIDPTGKYMYVVNAVGDTISPINIAADGSLTINGSAIATGTGPAGVAIDPTGQFIYVTNNDSNSGTTVSKYTASLANGLLTSQGTQGVGTAPIGCTLDPGGKFLYVMNESTNDISAFTITSGSGALTSIATYAAGTGPERGYVDPSGRFLYIANLYSSDISGYTIDSSTGALTSMGAPFSTGTNPQMVIVEPTGKFLYVANYTSNTIGRYSIDQTTGALTLLSSAAVGANPYSIAIAKVQQ